MGSLFYFLVIALKRRKLTQELHLPFCDRLESDYIHDLMEWPRDHFKSTICSEGWPMWRALPFNDRDEEFLRSQNYPDEFIAFMKRRHDPGTRILLASENITNAAKLGRRIRIHYESNSVYRTLFPETLPDEGCKWTDFSLTVRRPSGRDADFHGEGTFDFLGVGGALQSRHYTGGIVQDDLVGRKAVESPTIMDKTIEWHQLVVAATEDDHPDHDIDELVVGNRWAYIDLNSHILEHEPAFRYTTHSALGGCCDLHPANVPILPTIFSFEKLMERKRRLGNYNFSCFPAGSPVLMADLSEKPIEQLEVGDEIVGYEISSYSNLKSARVEFVNRRRAPVVKATTDTGRTIFCTHDHKWLVAKHRHRDRYMPLAIGRDIVSVYTPERTPTQEEQRILDWLGGVFDGEGSCGSCLHISQCPEQNPDVWAAINGKLKYLDIPFVFRRDCSQFILHGGRSLKIRLLRDCTMYKRQRFIKHFWKRPGRVAEDGGTHRIVNIEYVGEMDVYDIQSSTGNFVCYGYATKNCQYLNNPAPPEDADFKIDDLRYFEFFDKNGDKYIHHDVRGGLVFKDVKVSHLNKTLVTDPAHANAPGGGRCRHAICVPGLSEDGNFYLLETWAQACNYDTYFGKLYELAKKWRIKNIGFETVAAQRYAAYHIGYRNKFSDWPLKIIELKGEVEAPDGTTTRKKEWRIRNVLAPIFESGAFWMQKKDQDFFAEYSTFPHGRFVDQLDALAYAPQILRKPTSVADEFKMLALNQQRAKLVNQRYTVTLQ